MLPDVGYTKSSTDEGQKRNEENNNSNRVDREDRAEAF
jgi:hypothetical protein